MDVLVVCSRWFGGTMLGPIRFQHIEKSARAALEGWTEREKLVELWRELEKLDAVIEDLRIDLSSTTPSQSELQTEADAAETPAPRPPPKVRRYDTITNIAQLERLIKAKTLTVQTLINRVALQKT